LWHPSSQVAPLQCSVCTKDDLVLLTCLQDRNRDYSRNSQIALLIGERKGTYKKRAAKRVLTFHALPTWETTLHTAFEKIVSASLPTLVFSSALALIPAQAGPPLSVVVLINGAPAEFGAAGISPSTRDHVQVASPNSAGFSGIGIEMPQPLAVPTERLGQGAVLLDESAGGAIYSPFSSVPDSLRTKPDETFVKAVRDGQDGVQEAPDLMATVLAAGFAAVLLVYLVRPLIGM
jgi:hypothetical protein